MSFTLYIKDEKGTIMSYDKKKKYTMLTGKEAHKFLNSNDGKNKTFHFEIDENGDKFGIETTLEKTKKLQVEKERQRYLKKSETKYNISFISGNIEVEGTDKCELFDIIVDETINLEESLLYTEEIKELRDALKTLTKEEFDLISNLYLREITVTERTYGELTGLPQKTINYRKRKILRKIKKILEKNGSK